MKVIKLGNVKIKTCLENTKCGDQKGEMNLN